MKALSTAIAALLCGSLSMSLYADPPEGRGWKKHDKHHKHEEKEVYWEGNCRVERKWNSRGDYKEERTCRAPRYHHHDSAVRVVVLPPWFNQQVQEPEYRPEWRPTAQPSGTSCGNNKVSSVLGGLIGGVIGHQVGSGRGNTAATIGGAIAGVLIGGEVGRRMDQSNQACIAQALEFAPEGESISWQNAQGGENYTVVPGAVQQRGDQYCRSYTAGYDVSGDSRSTQAVACRQPNGTWVRAN